MSVKTILTLHIFICNKLFLSILKLRFTNHTSYSKYKMSKPSKRIHEETETTSNKKAKSGNKHWALGLLDSMNDPELQVTSDDLCVVIKDKYPKATFHYLVLPKEEISSLKKVNRDHVKLLEHMIKLGKTVIEEHADYNFKFGYHAEASMHRLHMHIISDDMNSPCLKNKKHWNTFTTKFFISAEGKISNQFCLPVKLQQLVFCCCRYY